MERWNTTLKERTENPKIDAFLEEVVSVCKKHDFSISHEDGYGAFEVVPFDSDCVDWLMSANDITNPTP